MERGAALPGHMIRPNNGGKRRVKQGCLVATPASPGLSPPRPARGGGAFQSDVRGPKRPEPSLASASCGGSESVGTAHRQTWGREGLRDARQD